MDAKEMKKILAGVGIAGLLSALPLTGGVAFGGSGCGSAKGGSGCGAKSDSSMHTEKSEAAGAGSGCSGSKGTAVTTDEESEKSMGAMGEDDKEMASPEGDEHGKMAPAGSSGCSGSK